CHAIVQPRTSMIQDDEALSVFTHSGPISAVRYGLQSDLSSQTSEITRLATNYFRLLARTHY
ncbi:hypothetical protein, partial [Pseudomonas orientalis]|uniref:hypothetical protein n=1 Tax=Pseudomonas orientalis TaxID=76758 RepID=UPI001A912B76